MSIEPPKTGKGTSGPIILLVFVSILLLVVILIFGMLAFVIDQPDNEQQGPDPATALVVEEFKVVTSATGKETSMLQVDVVIKNTSDKPVSDAQVIVQCEDDGYVSSIQAVPSLEREEIAVVPMQLSGTGDPTCNEPDIAFSSTLGN